MGIIRDGLRNLVSGLGTDRDKASSAEHHLERYTDDKLRTTYRTSSIAGKIIDIPADDATRNWREWQAEAKQISSIEAEEKRLGLSAKVRKALKLARLYGGSAIVIGDGSANPSEPLNPGAIKRDGLLYLNVLRKQELFPLKRQENPLLPGHGSPVGYRIGSSLVVHPSRLVVFQGTELLEDAFEYWSDSVLQRNMEEVRAVDAVAANILSLVYEAKIDIIKIPNLMSELASRGNEYTREFLEVEKLKQTAKGVNGALYLDQEQDHQQKTLSFSGLPDLWDRFMILSSAASDIPVTRLWGRSAAGMSSTGEGDEKNYFAKIKAIQTDQIGAGLALLDECLIRSALGDRPPEIHYNWRALSEQTVRERAEVADKITIAFERLERMELVERDPLANAIVNALTELGVAPGLEAALETTD